MSHGGGTFDTNESEFTKSVNKLSRELTKNVYFMGGRTDWHSESGSQLFRQIAGFLFAQSGFVFFTLVIQISMYR